MEGVGTMLVDYQVRIGIVIEALGNILPTPIPNQAIHNYVLYDRFI